VQPRQNLTFSLILYPVWLEPSAQFHLSMAVALALRDTVQVHVPAAVKWPNDLYLNGRKTAGVLIQNSLGSAGMQSSVVGIGLNVNQTDFPPELSGKATSLALETGTTFDLDDLLDTLLENLERRYLQLRAGDVAGVRRAYTEALYRLNIPASYQRPDGTVFTAVQRGVDERGRLVLETPAGTETFEIKEVAFV
jgi:BirA family biotin operon repressor/biotin-[acetyl-CoA-carboxylase] ligase